MEARRTTLELTACTVSLVEWAPSAPTGLTVLLLHGGGVDNAALSWGEVGPALARAGHRVLAPDHPGFGQSPLPRWQLTQERLLQVLGEVVDRSHLDEYVIGGLSMGGGLTLGHLLERPGRARAAMLLGSFGIMPRLTDGLWSGVQHWSTFVLLRSGLLAAMTRWYGRNTAAMERLLRSIVRNPAARTPALVRAVVEAASNGTALTAFAQWQRDQLLPRRLRTEYTDRLTTIETPVLLVHGERDGGVPIARARAAASALPHGRLLEVPGAGHWVQRDRPDVVVPGMLEFLRRLG